MPAADDQSVLGLDDALVADGRQEARIVPPTRREIVTWLVTLGGILGLALMAGGLAAVQGFSSVGAAIAIAGGMTALIWIWWGIFRTGSPSPALSTSVLFAVLATAAGSGEAVARAGYPWPAVLLMAGGAVAATRWTWKQFSGRPRNRTLAVVLTGLLSGGLTAWQMYRLGWTSAAVALAGVTTLGLLTVLGQAVLRGILAAPNGICAVARVIVEEAVRTRATLVLLVIVLVSLPSLPLVLDSKERLAYRIQFFLDWSLGGATFLLAMMTIFLVCGSICGDVDSRRVHMSLVKPLNRWQYLLGKLLGATLVNGLLLAIVGVGILTAARVLENAAATDPADRSAVEGQVLTARRTVRPAHPKRADFELDIDAEVDRLKQDDPSAFTAGEEAARARIQAQKVQQWHSVYPDMVSSYLFEGLDTARVSGGTVQLRLKPFADNVNVDRADVRFVLWLNDRPYPVEAGEHKEFTITSGMVHTLDLPSGSVDADGRLLVTFANRNLIPAGAVRPTAISFIPGQGMEMLYRVGTFEGNLLRGILICWIKLAMVAAAAVAAASWLGFPTAVLTALGIFAIASASAFLGDSLNIYTGADMENAGLIDLFNERLYHFSKAVGEWRFWTALKVVSSSVGEFLLLIVPSFGPYDAVTLVATGRVVSTADVLSCLAKVGLAGGGVLSLAAAALFHGRDLVVIGE